MAIVRSSDDCLVCRRELAEVYEKLGLYTNAIGEWERVARQTTDDASAEQIAAHLKPRP